MGFIFIIPIAALAGWSIFSIFRWLRREGFGQEWWRAYMILALVGIALGVVFAFFLQFRVANVHLKGFPIPVEIATREKPDAPWKKSEDMPAAIRCGGMITNLLSGVALCLAPIAVAAFFKQNRGKGPFANPNAP